MSSKQPEKNLESPELSPVQEDSPLSENVSEYELVEECDGSSEGDNKEGSECDGSSEGDNKEESETLPESKVSSVKCLDVALTFPLFRNLDLSSENKEGNLLFKHNESLPEAIENIDSQGFPFDDVIICDELIQKVDEYLHGDTENVNESDGEGFKEVGAIEEVETTCVEEGYDVVENAGVGLSEEDESSKKGDESAKDQETDSDNEWEIVRIVGGNESKVKSKLKRNEETNDESACDTLGTSIECEDDSHVHGTDSIVELNSYVILKDPSCAESSDVTSIESKDYSSIISTEDRCDKSKNDEDPESKDDMIVDIKDDANLESKDDVSVKSKDYANVESKDDSGEVSKVGASVQPMDDVCDQPTDIACDQPIDDVCDQPRDDTSKQTTDEVINQLTENVSDQPTNAVSVQPTDDTSIEPSNDVNVQPTDDTSKQLTDYVSIQPPNDFSIQPPNGFSIQPPNGFSLQPTHDFRTQPTDDTSEQPTDEVNVQPTDDVSVQPTNDVSVGDTSINTEDDDSDDAMDVDMESAGGTDDSVETVPLEVQHHAEELGGDPWSQPFSFTNLPSMFETDDAETIKAHWDLFCINRSDSCKEKFLKECVSLSKRKYFVEFCLNVSRDTRIMKQLDLILKVIHTGWTASSDVVVLRRSVLVIQALFSNKSCVLDSKQRMKLSEYLILMFTKQMDRKTFKTLMRSISYLLAEVVKKRNKNNEIDNDCFKDMVKILEMIFCKEVPVDSRILCGLVDTLILMPISAPFHILPKCFDKLCTVADNARDILRRKRDMPVEFPESSDSSGEFDNKMDELTSAVELYWKLCDACEILLVDFFEENFTADAVVDHVAYIQSFSFRRLRLPHESVASFYRKCLDYFGEALTNRLSAKYSHASILHFLETVDEYCSVRVLDNQFVRRTDHLYADVQESRAKRLKLYHGVRPTVKYTWLPPKFKNLELRCGLIDVSRAGQDSKNEVPKSLKKAQSLKPPDYAADTELLDKLSKIYAEGCLKHLKRTSI